MPSSQSQQCLSVCNELVPAALSEGLCCHVGHWCMGARQDNGVCAGAVRKQTTLFKPWPHARNLQSHNNMWPTFQDPALHHCSLVVPCMTAQLHRTDPTNAPRVLQGPAGGSSLKGLSHIAKTLTGCSRASPLETARGLRNSPRQSMAGYAKPDTPGGQGCHPARRYQVLALSAGVPAEKGRCTLPISKQQRVSCSAGPRYARQDSAVFKPVMQGESKAHG